MELAAIIAGFLIVTGILVAGAGAVGHHWAARHEDLLQDAGNRLSRRLGQPGRSSGHDRRAPGDRLAPGQGIPVLLLTAGLAVVMLAAVGLSKLVDDVTDGDGVAVLDHPVARFVAAHRAPALTWIMKMVSTVGGPPGMVGLALLAGLLLGLAWRSRTPMIMLAVTGPLVTDHAESSVSFEDA